MGYQDGRWNMNPSPLTLADPISSSQCEQMAPVVRPSEKSNSEGPVNSSNIRDDRIDLEWPCGLLEGWWRTTLWRADKRRVASSGSKQVGRRGRRSYWIVPRGFFRLISALPEVSRPKPPCQHPPCSPSKPHRPEPIGPQTLNNPHQSHTPRGSSDAPLESQR